ncbi:MAG: hypothetical protein ABIO70_08565 [Pseudomonadota bacterium]
MAAKGAPRTAAAAIEILQTCFLNRVSAEHIPTCYTVTAPSQDQRDILRSLDLEALVDDQAMTRRTHPR